MCKIINSKKSSNKPIKQVYVLTCTGSLDPNKEVRGESGAHSIGVFETEKDALFEAFKQAYDEVGTGFEYKYNDVIEYITYSKGYDFDKSKGCTITLTIEPLMVKLSTKDDE